ncbi:MAG: DUF4837 family protein [Bacteroidales bacterium]|nr:DUF4837 family protein [Bacteroidales bacterium]
MKLKVFSLLTLVLLVMSSCWDTSRSILEIEVTGLAGEVVVVMTPGKWKSLPGTEIKRILTTEQVGLPQEEGKFNPIFIPTDGFTSAIKTHRNILFCKINPQYKEKKIIFKESTYANTQLIMTAYASSDSACVNLFRENESKIIGVIEDMERKRLMLSYESHLERSIMKILNEEHQINLKIPVGYKLVTNQKGFVWMQNTHREVIEGLAIYYYDYKDKETFTKDYLIEKRNKILKSIPGETEGSYVGTEMRFPIWFNEYNLNGKRYTSELRGLWRIKEGLAMGGPFINISQLDEKRNRIVSIDAFIFAPGKDKCHLVRKSEAVMYTLDFPGISNTTN